MGGVEEGGEVGVEEGEEKSGIMLALVPGLPCLLFTCAF